MARSSDSGASDSDSGMYGRHEIKKKDRHIDRSRSSTKSDDRGKSKHKTKKRSRKRSHSSSDDECLKNKRRKKKDKDTKKKKKKLSKKKHKHRKDTDTSESNSESADEVIVAVDEKFRISNSKKGGGEDLNNGRSEEIEESAKIGPMLPPNYRMENLVESEDSRRTIGPMLPDHLRKEHTEDSEAIKSTNSLLPHNIDEHRCADMNEHQIDPSERIIGPALPSHLRDKIAGSLSSNIKDSPISSSVFGSQCDESEEEIYGPVPAGAALSRGHLELEERALRLQIDKLGPAVDDKPAREEWMIDLPAVKAANLGLGPRQFRTKAAPDLSDRSSWTDTPQDKANKKLKKQEEKVDYKKEAEIQAIRTRDKEQESVAKRSKREKHSLVEMHTLKMKKKKEESGPAERRPFSRDTDLQVNRFDEMQKKAVLKKAQLLDTRFSSGEAKYL